MSLEVIIVLVFTLIGVSTLLVFYFWRACYIALSEELWQELIERD